MPAVTLSRQERDGLPDIAAIIKRHGLWLQSHGFMLDYPISFGENTAGTLFLTQEDKANIDESDPDFLMLMRACMEGAEDALLPLADWLEQWRDPRGRKLLLRAGYGVNPQDYPWDIRRVLQNMFPDTFARIEAEIAEERKQAEERYQVSLWLGDGI